MKQLLNLIGGLLLAGLAGGVSAGPDQAIQKVVYHVNGDDDAEQAAALGNIQNHVNAVGAANLDLRVVLHGNGVSLLLLPDAVAQVQKMRAGNATPQVQAKVDTLKAQGVRFLVCANTLTGRAIDRERDLYMVDQGDVVPSGVAELAALQMQGYTYIKP